MSSSSVPFVVTENDYFSVTVDDGNPFGRNIYIGHLDRVEVLKALWKCAEHDQIYRLTTNFVPPEFDENKAKAAVSAGAISSFCGKYLHCDLRENYVDPTGFDQRWGEGAFAKVVQLMWVKQMRLPDLPVYYYFPDAVGPMYQRISVKDDSFMSIQHLRLEGRYAAFRAVRGRELYFDPGQSLGEEIFQNFKNMYERQQARNLIAEPSDLYQPVKVTGSLYVVFRDPLRSVPLRENNIPNNEK